MATAAKKSYGTLFKQGSTTIAEVTSVGEVGAECDAIDVTSFDSPSGWREFIAGLKSGGTVAIELNFIPGNASQQGLRTAVGGAASTYSVLFTDGGETYTFSAICTKFKANPSSPADSLKGMAEFQITGAITFS